MKIKQQRQINAFLVNLFGNSRGDMLFRQQEELLDTLIRNTENKTKDQMKNADSDNFAPYSPVQGTEPKWSVTGGCLQAYAKLYAGYRWNRKAFVHGKNGTGAGILFSLQQYFPSCCAKNESVGQ